MSFCVPGINFCEKHMKRIDVMNGCEDCEKEEKKMTNYDKIKTMSIEEMHSFLADIKQGKFEHVYIREWLGEKTKPILSAIERMILENIDKDYKWIARDEDDELCFFTTKPIKGVRCWSTDEINIVAMFNHLFQFITWEDSEPYNIEDLLKE